MKAITYTEYGPPEVLRMTEVATPEPGENEILVKVHATTVTAGDWRLRSLNVPFGFKFLSRLMFGFSKPKNPILGMELSGVVEKAGANVSQFKTGDPVFAFRAAEMGAYAEYVCMSEDGQAARKPSNLSFEEAATLSFGGTTALHFFRQGNLKSGEKVLNKGGRLLKVLGDLKDMLQAPLVSLSGNRNVIAGPASGTPEDLQILAELAEAGSYKPVIDRTWPFEEMVEAHRYVDTGRKRGNVVVTLPRKSAG